MSKEIPWGRVTVEGVVIVLSILLAFAIEAGWDARQASAGQKAFAEALAVEARRATDDIEFAIRVHTRAMCRTQKWISISQSTPLDSIAGMVSALTRHRTPQLSLSSVEALLSTGAVASIQDQGLREWVSAWPGVKQDLEEEMEAIDRFARFVVPEYFVSHGIAFAALTSPPHPLFPREALLRLVGDPGFQSLMTQAFSVSEVFVREGRRVAVTLRKGEAFASEAVSGIRPDAGQTPMNLDLYIGSYVPTPETLRGLGDSTGEATGTRRTFVQDGRLVLQDPRGEFLTALEPDGEHSFRTANGVVSPVWFDVESGAVTSLRLNSYAPCQPDQLGPVQEWVPKD
jgi:hypothetical protein